MVHMLGGACDVLYHDIWRSGCQAYFSIILLLELFMGYYRVWKGRLTTRCAMDIILVAWAIGDRMPYREW